MTGPYDLFKTDTEIEVKGVELDYGDFYLVIARAGGKNKAFAKYMERAMRPYRRALQTDTLSDEVAEQVLKQAYAEKIVLGWGCKDDEGEMCHGEMKDGNGEMMPFSAHNVVKLFDDLPDLFQDVREQASKVGLFRLKDVEEDAGN
jgi:hypothetical protein